MASEPSLIDVAPMLKEFGVLKKDAGDDLELGESVGGAFLEAIQVTKNVEECVLKSFPNGIPVSEAFFDQLGEFHRWIGVSESGDEALGLVWSEAMRQLPQEKQQELLSIFAQLQGHAFFEYSRSVWVVARDHQFPARFLAEWFASLLKAVERDYMQQDVWKTIRTVCVTYRSVAIDVLKQYLIQHDERICNIAAYMLGVLRSESSQGNSIAGYTDVEMSYRSSGSYLLRSAFNYSWVTTGRDRELKLSELEELFARSEQSEDDLTNVVCVICRIAELANLPQQLSIQAIEWLNQTIAPALSGLAKHCVACTTSRLCGGERKSEYFGTGRDWILAIQPIPSDDKATWRQIGEFLCHALKRDIDEFSLIFLQLCSTSANAIQSLIVDGTLRHLTHELVKYDAGVFVTKLALSIDTASRRLGLLLLGELDIKELSRGEVEISSEDAIELLFYEAQRTILGPRIVGRVLAALASTADKMPHEFQAKLSDEIERQCRNFSGGCRAELERLTGGSPLIARAIRNVSGYFVALERAHEAGINAMDVVGIRKAAREQSRRNSKHMMESARSASPLFGLFKQIFMLYGSKSSHYQDHVLSDARPYADISSSIEIPIVDVLDPEEMALRQMNASANINRVLDERGVANEEFDER